MIQQKIKKIDSLETYIVRLPLLKPFVASFAVQTYKEALLVRMNADGMSGWGECVALPAPYYSYETNETAFHILKDFMVPILTAMRDFSVEEAMTAFERIRGHFMAKAVVENALLDLLARLNGVPLYQLIGGEAKKIMSGISIGIKETPVELVEAVHRAMEKKYHRVKLKIERGKDIEYITAVRKDFPNIRLMMDANSDYTIEDSEMLIQLDDFNLMMIEQPLDENDIYFHSLLQKEMRTPICLDESIESLQDAETAVELGSCRVINIKQGRVGGVLNARSIQAYCRDNGIPVWSGGMLETGIGRAVNIHLQTLPGFVLPGDTSETGRYFAEDIVDPPVVLDPKGYIDIPAGVGIGVQVNPEKIERFKVSYHKLI